MPKCCPPHHVLSKNAQFHGLSCQPDNHETTLPQVPIIEQNGDIRDMDQKINNRYFHSGFPSCEGVNDDETNTDDWNYVLHNQNMFVLKKQTVFEYMLYVSKHVFDTENQTRNEELIYSNCLSL